VAEPSVWAAPIVVAVRIALEAQPLAVVPNALVAQTWVVARSGAEARSGAAMAGAQDARCPWVLRDSGRAE
jgi:hypothetical protein